MGCLVVVVCVVCFSGMNSRVFFYYIEGLGGFWGWFGVWFWGLGLGLWVLGLGLWVFWGLGLWVLGLQCGCVGDVMFWGGLV